MTELKETPTAPWARVTGRVITPNAGHGEDKAEKPTGVERGTVTFTPDPCTVKATLDTGEALVATSVRCDLDSEGFLLGPDGARGVDLIAPGDGVEPEGAWTYLMEVYVPGWGSRSQHVTLTPGAVNDINSLIPTAEYRGNPVTVAEGAAKDAAESAALAHEALNEVRRELADGIHDGDKGDQGEQGPPGPPGLSLVPDKQIDGLYQMVGAPILSPDSDGLYPIGVFA